ncbi:MAG: PASTA domain-containing protein, partial [Oscillospiraceae bacterium]|nr:PASTA domain-containing protein [Oscillospiraceae bacterium]
DFGIAQMATSQATLTSEALGSVHYISPEQAKGAHIDERADLYSLGVVLYEMLCGRPPYDGETPVAVAIQHIHGTPARPSALNPAVPESLEAITLHAMKADPAERYTSASEMLADLEAFRKNPDTNFISERGEFIPTARTRRDQTNRQIPSEAKVKSPTSSRAAIIAGAVCIVLAFCGIGYFLYSFFFSGLFAKTAEDTVPKFIGHSYETIDPNQYENFRIELKKWKSSDEYAYGVVMDQTPTAGRSAKVGTTIELTVSSGSEGNQMPNLVNLSLQNAQSLLNTMSVSVVVEVAYKPSDVYTDGYVVSTVPEQGATLTDGQIVTVYVSQGSAAELVRVPALVGVAVEQALTMIDDARLARGSVLSVDSELPPGTVTFQSIDADEMVKKGTVVNLQVARGSLHAEAPELLGQSRDVEGYRGDEITLEVNALSPDGGVLTYSWYASKTSNTENAKIVAASNENGAKYEVDTNKTGTQYYFCRIVNTRGTSSESVWSDPIRVEIAKERAPAEKQIEVILPEEDGRYVIAVYVGGDMQIEPFEVDTNELTGNGLYLTVSGTGTQTVTAFVNGDEYDSWLIDFDTAG